jgi:hypothetical protein
MVSRRRNQGLERRTILSASSEDKFSQNPPTSPGNLICLLAWAILAVIQSIGAQVEIMFVLTAQRSLGDRVEFDAQASGSERQDGQGHIDHGFREATAMP